MKKGREGYIGLFPRMEPKSSFGDLRETNPEQRKREKEKNHLCVVPCGQRERNDNRILSCLESIISPQ